jgi:hypothetical protein
MALHAVDDVSDAFATTRAFLFPFELRRWLKLALVALFVGGGVSLPTAQFNTGGGFEPGPGTELPNAMPEGFASLVAVAVAAAVVLGVVFSLVGSIMEFVLVESLRTGEVTLRRHWGRRWRQGLRLFGFRLAIGIPFFALVVGWLGLLVAPGLFPGVDPVVPAGALLFVGLPVIFLLGVLYALVSAFTSVFVVPIMIETDGGVLDGWRRLWGSIKAEPKEYFAYAVIGFVLSVAAGIAASLVVGLVALGLLLPFALVGLLVYVTVSLSSTAGLAILAALGIVFVVALVVCWLLVQVPVLTYLRYYALLVLGDVDGSLDLIPDQRAAARE